MKVYLLWLIDGSYDESRTDVVGVYATSDAARQAQDKLFPGYKEYVEKLSIWTLQWDELYENHKKLNRKKKAATEADHSIFYAETRKLAESKPKFLYSYGDSGQCQADGLRFTVEELEVQNDM